ncbi:MAG: DUF438 domain-containing protein [Coriobacteriia bacterium]
MNITADTKIHDLLGEYPHLKEWLLSYAPAFEKLGNPVVYNTVGRVATIEAAARMADIEPATLVDAIRTRVAEHAIITEEAAGAAPRLADDERERRQSVLKDLIRELHDGAPVEFVKSRFDELVRDIDAAEVALMEQSLIAEGMPVEEVQRLCDVHVTVFKDSLDDGAEIDVSGAHPIDAYLRENRVAAEITASLRSDLATLAGGDDDEMALADIAVGLGRLAQLAVHFKRKENQLFPVLEQHGVEGPTKVMWSLDDEILARIKNDRALAEMGDAALLGASLEVTLTAVDDMIYKEEKILFPTALQVITTDEWDRLAAGDAEIGYAWIEGPEGDAARAAATALEPTVGGEGLMLPLVTGSLTVEQLNLMFGVLPFDLSFVDENDRVRFYSEGERVFPRSPAVIGREVRNCHPPKSLGKVEEILSEFKSGAKDTAEFWIAMGGRFLHIRYFAMRDAHGAYRGCLETVQDATHVRELEGERRIVDW